MAYVRNLSKCGKPALRLLASAGECSSAAGKGIAGLEGIQGAALRSEVACSGEARLFSSSRTFQAQSTAEAADAAFDRVKASPARLYAAIGGAIGASAGVYYLLFGGSGTGPLAPEEIIPKAGLSTDHIGDYDVLTHTGDSFTNSELSDEFAIVYFGATTAVDCVSEIEKLGEIVQQSDRKSNMHYLKPLFVTVEPETDTQEKMSNVVELFNSKHNRKHVRLTGLTGPDTVMLHQAAVEFSGKDSPDPSQPDNRFYVVNPQGEFVKAYAAGASVAEISDELFDIIKSYSLNHPAWHGPKKVARRHA